MYPCLDAWLSYESVMGGIDRCEVDRLGARPTGTMYAVLRA